MCAELTLMSGFDLRRESPVVNWPRSDFDRSRSTSPQTKNKLNDKICCSNQQEVVVTPFWGLIWSFPHKITISHVNLKFNM